MKFALTKNNIADYGLAYFFEVCKDLVISKEYIETLYRVIIKLARAKLRPLQTVPEMPEPDDEGNEPSEEVKAAAQKKIDDVTKLNQEAEKINDEITRL